MFCQNNTTASNVAQSIVIKDWNYPFYNEQSFGFQNLFVKNTIEWPVQLQGDPNPEFLFFRGYVVIKTPLFINMATAEGDHVLWSLRLVQSKQALCQEAGQKGTQRG